MSLCPGRIPAGSATTSCGVARNRDDGVTIEQIATNFGVHRMTLTKWMRQASIDEGAKPGRSSGSPVSCGTRGVGSSCWSGKTRSCAGPRHTCRKPICREWLYPLVSELAADGILVAVTCRVLKLARHPYCRWRAIPITDAEVIEAYRANALFDSHLEDPEFDYRYLGEEEGDAGEPMAERAAWRNAP